jgi:hypothetical protein
MPNIAIPLQPNKVAIPLDLHNLLRRIYDRACYRLVINYTQPPILTLRATAQDWAKQRIEQHRAQA